MKKPRRFVKLCVVISRLQEYHVPQKIKFERFFRFLDKKVGFSKSVNFTFREARISKLCILTYEESMKYGVHLGGQLTTLRCLRGQSKLKFSEFFIL